MGGAELVLGNCAAAARTRHAAAVGGARLPARALTPCRTSTRCAPRSRADYERALGARRRRRARSRMRFERFFTELRDPLVAALRRRPALPGGSGRALLDAIAAHRRRAPPRAARARPRARDHARLAAARAGGRLRRLRRPLRRHAARACASGCRYLRELGVSYLHLMPLLRARPGAQRRRLRGRRLRRGRARARARWTTCARSPPTCARPGWRCASTSCSTTPRASTPWAQAALAGDARKLAFYRTFPDRTEPDAYERTLPEVFPDTAPGQLHAGSRSSSAGCGRRSTTTSGTSTTRTPRSSSRWPRRCSASRPPASTCCASTPCRSCGSATGTNCQNQPEVHELLQALPRRDADRRAGRRLQGRGDRLAARPRRATSAPGAHEGKECDLAYHNVLMVLLWSALASRPRRRS